MTQRRRSRVIGAAAPHLSKHPDSVAGLDCLLLFHCQTPPVGHAACLPPPRVLLLGSGALPVVFLVCW